MTALIWDFEQPVQSSSNRPFYTKVLPSHAAAPVELQVSHLRPGESYRLQVYRAGYQANDAYTAYLEMGAPKILSPKQIADLNQTDPRPGRKNEIVHAGKDGDVKIDLADAKQRHCSGHSCREPNRRYLPPCGS